MTTIAYRDGVLAADTLVSSGDIRVGRAVKIVQRGPILAGASGHLNQAQQFLDWVISGCDGEAPLLDDNCDGFLVFDDYILTRSQGWDRLTAPYYASGSGRHIALGAMAAGATAHEAVRAAIALDTSSGGDITVLRR